MNPPILKCICGIRRRILPDEQRADALYALELAAAERQRADRLAEQVSDLRADLLSTRAELDHAKAEVRRVTRSLRKQPQRDMIGFALRRSA